MEEKEEVMPKHTDSYTEEEFEAMLRENGLLQDGQTISFDVGLQYGYGMDESNGHPVLRSIDIVTETGS